MTIIEKVINYFDLRKPFVNRKTEILENSNYVLMPRGSMRPESLGRSLFKTLMKAYKDKYVDKPDHEALLAAISANFQLETENAWLAFLAEVEPDND